MSLKFDPANPVPLLSSIENTYAQAKLHSSEADLFFGYRIDAIEADLKDRGTRAWLQFGASALATENSLHAPLGTSADKARFKGPPTSRSLDLSSSHPRVGLASFAGDPLCRKGDFINQWALRRQSDSADEAPSHLSNELPSQVDPAIQAGSTIQAGSPVQVPNNSNRNSIQSRNYTDPKSVWIGLDPSVLQTPYTELRYAVEMLQLRDTDFVVDLGAAYGRMAMVLGTYHPQIRFLGFEILPERNREAARVIELQGFANAQVIQANVCDDSFQIPSAQVYFIYDLSRPELIEKLLLKLQKLSLQHPVTVVGRGLATRHQIETQEFWLSDIVTPEHHGTFSIYRTHANSR